jgi:hypothetical protein
MIQTNRCELTNLQSNDWELVKKLYTNIQVRRFLGGVVDLHSVHLKFLNMLEIGMHLEQTLERFEAQQAIFST